MAKTYPFISVVIPAYNESEHLEATITCLRNCEYDRDSFEIIVVDNNSTDATKEIADRYADKPLFLEHGNVGAVRNYGAKHARGEILAFLDADCLVHTDWLSNIAKLIEDQPDIAFGGTCRLLDETNWLEKYWLLGDGTKKQKDLVGATIGIQKTTFWQIDGFDETVTSGEDTDFSCRLRAHGTAVVILPDLSVKHAGNANTPWSFIRRQIWHSENYFQNPKSTIKDPTFLLCFMALVSLVSTPILALEEPQLAFICLSAFFLIPAAFSIKRMSYARTFKFSPKEILKIYTLDALYVFGRCIGIIKSMINVLKNRDAAT